MKRMIDEEIINRAKKATIAVVVSNIKQISDEILSSLKAGDIVQKEDSSGKHSYVVSFKKDGTGICLTYTDASIVETQSYDFTDGHWVYNSEDKMPLVNVEDAPSGEIADALGLDASGHVVKGQASGGGGTKLYLHTIPGICTLGAGVSMTLKIISISNTPIAFTSETTISQKNAFIRSLNVVNVWLEGFQANTPILQMSGNNDGTAYGGIYIEGVSTTYSLKFKAFDFVSKTDTVTEL